MSKPRRPHTAEAIRQEVVRDIRAGEVTEPAAAARLGVSRQSIRRWLSRGTSKRGLSRFLPVALTRPEILACPVSSPSLVEIALRDGRVMRVPLDVDAATVGRFVRAFESAC